MTNGHWPRKLWQLKDITPDKLLLAVKTTVFLAIKLSPAQLGDICTGNVLQLKARAFMAQITLFMSDTPETDFVYCQQTVFIWAPG